MTIDQDAQNDDVRRNSSRFHLVRKGDGGGVMLCLHEGSENLVELDD